MPSNIFATTGTNVSILFIDKTNTDGKIVLMDASKLGAKVKEDGKNQKTVLSNEEIATIIDTFNEQKSVDDFCAVVSYEDIAAHKLSFSAGQYFDVKIEYAGLTLEQFNEIIDSYKKRLLDSFNTAHELDEQIMSNMENLKYDI
jgi:type I restriction enzyme M protein